MLKRVGDDENTTEYPDMVSAKRQYVINVRFECDIMSTRLRLLSDIDLIFIFVCIVGARFS